MNPSPRHVFLPLAAVAAATAVAAFVSGRRAEQASALPVPPVPTLNPAAFETEPAPATEPGAWASLAPDRAKGGLARRFRLAGTLFGVAGGLAEVPLAVVDDREEMRQHLVRQGEEVVDGVRLVEVRPAEAVLEGPEGQAVLAVERAVPASGRPSDGSSTSASAVSAEGSGNRFGGHEVFPGRWEFSREKLLEYYTELRAEPERLVAVFDSMEPLYKNGDPSTHIIEGYQLNVQGEGAFFEAMGMRQGDIVRAVNSVQMANRRRAERCIAAFVQGEEDTFVFDIERDGAPSQQVYVFQ